MGEPSKLHSLSYPWGRCRAGCGDEPRSVSAILEELQHAPARELRTAQLAAARNLPMAAHPREVQQATDAASRPLLVARLTRAQLELSGFCRYCAMRGQFQVFETATRAEVPHV